MSQSKTYILPIAPGVLIELLTKLNEMSGCPIKVVDDKITDTNIGVIAMEFCESAQLVHLQMHPERNDQSLAFFEGDPRLAEILEMDGLTLSYKNFYDYLAVAGADEALLDLLTDHIILDDPSEVYMPIHNMIATDLAGRILTLNPKNRATIEKILAITVTDLDSTIAAIEGLEEAQISVLTDAVVAGEYELVNVFARRLTSEVSRSSDLVREICASIINQNTTHTFTGASWAIKESWAAVASLSFEQKGLMQEVLERAADGSLNPEWTAEHVPYFGKSETEAGDKIHLKVTTTMVEEKLVDSVSLMAGIGIGVIVGVVGTILFRKFNN